MAGLHPEKLVCGDVLGNREATRDKDGDGDGMEWDGMGQDPSMAVNRNQGQALMYSASLTHSFTASIKLLFSSLNASPIV